MSKTKLAFVRTKMTWTEILSLTIPFLNPKKLTVGESTLLVIRIEA